MNTRLQPFWNVHDTVLSRYNSTAFLTFLPELVLSSCVLIQICLASCRLHPSKLGFDRRYEGNETVMVGISQEKVSIAVEISYSLYVSLASATYPRLLFIASCISRYLATMLHNMIFPWPKITAVVSYRWVECVR